MNKNVFRNTPPRTRGLANESTLPVYYTLFIIEYAGLTRRDGFAVLRRNESTGPGSFFDKTEESRTPTPLVLVMAPSSINTGSIVRNYERKALEVATIESPVWTEVTKTYGERLQPFGPNQKETEFVSKVEFKAGKYSVKGTTWKHDEESPMKATVSIPVPPLETEAAGKEWVGAFPLREATKLRMAQAYEAAGAGDVTKGKKLFTPTILEVLREGDFSSYYQVKEKVESMKFEDEVQNNLLKGLKAMLDKKKITLK